MEEGEDPGGGGAECCRRMRTELKREFDKRFRQIEQTMERKEGELRAYVDQLRRSVEERDEQLKCKEAEIAEQAKKIASLEEKGREREGIIRELEQRIAVSKGRSPQRKQANHGGREARSLTNMALEELFERPFNRYFTMQIKNDEKKSMCPFEMERDIAAQIGGKPKSIRKQGQSGLLVEVATESQSTSIMTLTTVLGKECSIKEHASFNGKKAIIYVYNNSLTNIESFKQGLRKVYPVGDVQRATWIKPRDANCQALLLQFSTDNPPEYIRITGEYSLTKVYVYNERPMMCDKCQKYGHRNKHCRAEQLTCGWCAGSHQTSTCDRTRVDAKCANCEGAHSTLSAACTVRRRECEILEVQQKEKVDRWQASRILSGHERSGYVEGNQKYERFVNIEVENGKMREICPFEMERYLQLNYDVNRTDITTHKNGYIVKIESKEQYDRIKPLSKLVEVPCKVLEDGEMLKAYNNTKGLVYITDFDVDNLTTLEEGLKLRYNISEVRLAHWIHPRNEKSKAFLITFNESRIPSSLYIPGEARVRVYPYLNRPLICKNCFGYGHPAKYCKNAMRCVKCGGSHQIVECKRIIPECIHCGGELRPGARECLKQKQKEEMIKIQHQEKTSMAIARQRYLADNDRHKKTYADLVKYSKTKAANVPNANQGNERKSSDQEESAEKVSKK